MDHSTTTGRVRVMALGATAGVCLSWTALAQSTAINFEASLDGGSTWARDVTASVGSDVQVRMRVELLGATALGLAGFTCQPLVSNWSADVDVVRAFTFPGVANNGTPTTETTYEGRAVRSTPASNTGRIYPYGAAGQGTTSASGLLAAHVGPDTSMWFAGSRATAPGIQPQFGLVIAQETPSLVLTNFNASTNTTVFRFAITVNAGAVRTVGLASLYAGHVLWHTTSNGLNPLTVSSVQVNSATITTVPGPGAIGLVAVVGLVGARRRR